MFDQIHQLNGREFDKLQELTVDKKAWLAAVHGGHKESDTTEWLNWTELRMKIAGRNVNNLR